MSIYSLIRRAPRRTSAIALMIAAAIIVPSTLLAWGPSRDTYTYDDANKRVCLSSNTSTCVKPAQPVFNSITNTPHYGDERNFVTIKSTDGGSGTSSAWTDELNIQNNKEYFVRMYVHNNAEAEHVAQNVTAKFNLPTQSAKRIQIDGYLSSTNAVPTEVWDQAVFNSTGNFSLKYVTGSATYTNNNLQEQTRVFNLPDSVVGNGAQLGYDSMNGNIPGCFQYAGYVVFKVKAVTSDFDVQKTVRVNGAEDQTFKEDVTVKPGDKVDYQIHFKNTGGTTLNDVSVEDKLPVGVSYVPGTTYLYTAAGKKLVADGVTTTGINIGDAVPTAEAYIRFTAKVNGDINLPICGNNTARNTVKVITGVATKQDTADLTINKTCEPNEISVCVLPTESTPARIVKINESDFDSKTMSKDLSDCVELPHTGPTENIVAMIGLGALVASIGYYVASRRVGLNQ